MDIYNVEAAEILANEALVSSLTTHFISLLSSTPCLFPYPLST
jgi:hypothetical protein